MKNINIIILILLICLISCSKFPKEEVLISDYVQISNGVKTDMKFKILEINEQENVISNRDSLVILFSDLTIKYKSNLIEGKWDDLSVSKENIETLIKNYKVSEWVLFNLNNLKEYRHSLDSLSNQYKILSERFSNLPLSEKIRNIERRESTIEYKSYYRKKYSEALSDSLKRADFIQGIERLNEKEYEVLLFPYYVKYEIHNPLLNNVKQEITNIFYFNGKKDKIIDIINAKKLKLEL